MSGSTVTDLDVLAPETKRVKLYGQEYVLPGDIPVADMVAIEALGQRAEKGEIDEFKAGELLYGAVLEIFRVHQPELERLPLGPEQLMGFLPLVYGEAEETEEDAEGKPPAEAGTTNGSGKGKPRAPKRGAPRRS